MKEAIASVSSGISAGTLTGSSDPLMRSAGGAPAFKWMSEAPFFTAAARSWLKVLCSIALAPRLRASFRELRIGLAQTFRKRCAETAIDLHRQLVVGSEQFLEVAPGDHQQLDRPLGHHVG